MPTDPKYLKNFACFQGFSDEQLDAVAEITNAVCYPPDYLLFEEGQPGERILFLESGEVEVEYNIGESGPVCLDTVSGHEVVGCSALVEPYIYTATERSLTQVEVLEVNAEALRALMQADCRLGAALQNYLLQVLMERILNLRLKASPCSG